MPVVTAPLPIIEQVEAETAIDKRKPIYSSLADRVNQDAALIFAYQADTFVARNPEGWRLGPALRHKTAFPGLLAGVMDEAV
ncbi:MAG TPA: hypothetical protein VKV73_15035 [Chloroflexota bacterium]|nr:hypothetical protein [Chloroflexota bacterium]